MKTDAEFWDAVNTALDERRDPLADDGVQDALAERPERLDALLALERRLAALPRLQPELAHRPWLVAAAAAAVILTLGGVGALVLWRLALPVPVDPTTVSAFDVGEQVIDFRIEVSRSVGGRRTVVRVVPDGTLRTQSLDTGETLASVSIESTRGNQP
ncbi:MAG: hypothetical protein L6Q99_12840 [Planctomycetes bacterium]|nr:hypothetical protein [Planctomycetota bacterium]